MVYFNKYDEENKNWFKINNQLLVSANEYEVNGQKENFDTSIIVFDKKDNGIKHYIKTDVEWMENGQIKIPSTICTKILKLNSKDTDYELIYKQVGNKAILSTNAFWHKPITIDVKDLDANNIIMIINKNINKHSELANDINIQKGLEIINPILAKNIDYMLNIWHNLDIDSYIEEQKKAIKMYELDYLNKIAPINSQIELLQEIQKENKTK